MGNTAANCLQTGTFATSNDNQCEETTQLYTHVSHGLADESQLSGLVDGAPQLAGVAAIWRHRLRPCDGQRQETRRSYVRACVLPPLQPLCPSQHRPRSRGLPFILSVPSVVCPVLMPSYDVGADFVTLCDTTNTLFPG